MAHFIGYLQGNRGAASRLGTKNSGVDVTARGWNIGGSVRVYHAEGKDYVVFTLDGGSNDTNEKLRKIYTHDENGNLVELV